MVLLCLFVRQTKRDGAVFFHFLADKTNTYSDAVNSIRQGYA